MKVCTTQRVHEQLPRREDISGHYSEALVQDPVSGANLTQVVGDTLERRQAVAPLFLVHQVRVEAADTQTKNWDIEHGFTLTDIVASAH